MCSSQFYLGCAIRKLSEHSSFCKAPSYTVERLREALLPPIGLMCDWNVQGCAQNATDASYGDLLAELDGAAARQIHESLRQLPELCEPHVAHDLAQALPPGKLCPLLLLLECTCKDNAAAGPPSEVQGSVVVVPEW